MSAQSKWAVVVVVTTVRLFSLLQTGHKRGWI